MKHNFSFRNFSKEFSVPARQIPLRSYVLLTPEKVRLLSCCASYPTSGDEGVGEFHFFIIFIIINFPFLTLQISEKMA
jgi:hypothetical protein